MMLRRMLIAVFVLLAIGIVAGPDAEAGGWPEDPTGAWMEADASDGNGSLITLVRIGPGLWNTVSYYAGPYSSPLFVRESPYVGITRRVGRDDFEYSLIQYRVGSDEKILAVVRVTGTGTIREDDSFHSSETYAIYSPDQDPYGDEPPTYGYWGPYEGLRIRITFKEEGDE